MEHEEHQPSQIAAPTVHPIVQIHPVILFLFGLILIEGSLFIGIQIGKAQNQKPVTRLITPSPLPIQDSSSPIPTTPLMRNKKNVAILPIPTISQISICTNSFSPLKPESILACQIIELRARDLLQSTYNLHHLLREIQNNQIQQSGFYNKINDLNNNLIELWLNIAGYGLGTDPYVGIQIQVAASGFKEAKGAPSYGTDGRQAIGIPRLYAQFLENSGLSKEEIRRKEEFFLALVQSYSNPSQYPFRDFEDRGYNDYRNGKQLTSAQYETDLNTLDEWLTKLEGVLRQIPLSLK